MDRGLTLNIFSAVCNLAIFLLVAISIAEFYSAAGGSANMKVKKIRCFEYFTVDSNILAAVAAFIMLVFNVLGFINGSAIPAWVMHIKFIGSVAVGLTFFVVMLLLAPYAGYRHMLEGCSLFTHLIVPVLAMLSFICFDGGGILPAYAIALALIPAAVYGAVYFRMVVIVGEDKGGWNDFYGFNKGGKWYLSVLVILLMTLVIAFLLRLGHNALYAA